MIPAEVKRRCDELEDLAYNAAEMPRRLSTPDQILFLKFRHLYGYARLNAMTPEQGKREKQEILLNYTVDLLNADIYAKAAQLWKNVEAAISTVRKDDELMHNPKVQALVSVIDGVASGR